MFIVIFLNFDEKSNQSELNKNFLNSSRYSNLNKINENILSKENNENFLENRKNIKKCENIPELFDGAKKFVTKVIDGDTFLIEGGYSVRILGIDADERGYPCYDEAKKGLEDLVLGKEVRLEAPNQSKHGTGQVGKEDLDKYCRYLRYVFVPASGETSAGRNDKNVSLEMVKNGLAVARFSPKDIKYRKEITLAEKWARENKVGCKWSSAVQE
jgi:micrococcal nuclease